VSGVIGYRGDDLTTVTGADPQTITADGSGTPVNVIANQTSSNTLATGGVEEFHRSTGSAAEAALDQALATSRTRSLETPGSRSP
jgi:hypothetical protein